MLGRRQPIKATRCPLLDSAFQAHMTLVRNIDLVSKVSLVRFWEYPRLDKKAPIRLETRWSESKRFRGTKFLLEMQCESPNEDLDLLASLVHSEFSSLCVGLAKLKSMIRPDMGDVEFEVKLIVGTNGNELAFGAAWEFGTRSPDVALCKMDGDESLPGVDLAFWASD
ncbi:hypothetical protein K493DRAFT_360682 [Basidiobolus meristosporus CBS 931.73]|uniref:Uncharacterized protein n=1 Tax=Basidiobolus meristosporus CBS 931.73 TaxID=1314790 RepID=A0A1Y1XFG6_9FUNG|nr:hypothetical protein K493DRAFT_360682 [Basidiobolus meristosporus CBS 931.73]|eukprot:ORX84511.1 hypothetical protein K493DRAFT_360682 [Basidiobolus meristosporus CBS 931.73]